MRFFRRSGDSPPPEQPTPASIDPIDVDSDPAAGPDWARAALAGLRLPSGLRPSRICGPRGEAWAATVPGDRAIEAWQALRDRRAAGWWPIVIGAAADEERLVEAANYSKGSIDETLRLAEGLDPDALSAEWRAQLADDGGVEWDDEDGPEPPTDEDLVGEWPRDRIQPMTCTLPYDVLTRKPQPTILALVPARESIEVPAVLGWGGWNECPPPEAHVAVHRRWAERYGAEVVGTSFDVIEMRVARPPTTREAAMALAHEQFAYCPDIVVQGTDTISNLAATLLGGGVWYFWWD